MSSTTAKPPSLRDFYEGLYYSPIYAQHHRVTCNVGFHPLSPLGSTSTVPHADDDGRGLNGKEAPLTDAIGRYHQTHNPSDLYQLQLYQELVTMVPLRSLLLGTATVDNEPEEALRHRPLAILDVGCGAGGGVSALQGVFPHAQLTGVDISSQAIVRAKENWLRLSRHVPALHNHQGPRWINQNCEHMRSIRSSSMDIAVAVQTLQEVECLPSAIRELTRIVRPGGVLFVADFIPTDPRRDHLARELLGPSSSLASDDQADGDSLPVGRLWDVEQERIVSFNAALACKLNSDRMQALIREFIPEEFRVDMETLFFVEHSTLWTQLQQGNMGYRLACLRRKGELANPFDHVLGPAKEDQPRDGESDDDNEDEEDEDDIDDDDLPNYYEPAELFPELAVLRDHYDVIVEEMQAVLAAATWPFWPEKHYTEGESEWRVFPFCYTFPAYDASKTTWVEATCGLCPRTVALLRGLPGIRTALFSKLGPTTTLSAHRGWADLSNHILRCHLGLVVPTLASGEPCCAMVVGGEERFHGERELLVFDDSKLHYAFNNHPEATRLVLIVDLYRPDHLPRGRATGGHTDELDAFINQFGQHLLNDGGEDDPEANGDSDQ